MPPVLPCLQFSHFIAACVKFAGPAQSHRVTTLDYLTGRFPEGAY